MGDGISEILGRIRDCGRERVLVAIDGRCGAGKTTLAGKLGEEAGCPIVHMDHFFLRPEQRTKDRLGQPGGNVDYERVREEVLFPLSQGRIAVYRPFDCGRMELSGLIQVEPKEVVVVEGSYSCHPALWDFYGLRIFLDISPEEQMKRILHRNGREAASVFRERWIPLEERYFAAYQIRERCDLVVGQRGRKGRRPISWLTD